LKKIEVDALIAAAPETRSFKFSAELFLLALLLGAAVCIGAWRVLPRGVVVIRPVRSGVEITPADVKLVVMPANPAFRDLQVIRGLLARRDLSRGEPLREGDAGTVYAVAGRPKQAGETLTAADVEYQSLPYTRDAFVDHTLLGRSLLVSIPQGAVIQQSMLAIDGGRIARRDIVPFRILTKDDVKNPPARSCAIVPVRGGAVLRSGDVISIDPRFDAVTVVTLAGAPPRAGTGTPAVLWSASKGRIADVQILQTSAPRYVIACRSADVAALVALNDLRAVQEVQ
jgi:flagella basal body P-ring formation protein FlgA